MVDPPTCFDETASLAEAQFQRVFTVREAKRLRAADITYVPT
jgi:hypothetical protein